MVAIEESTVYKIEKIRQSGISEAFTPSTPVNPNFFCGRTNEVDRILSSVVSSKNHILLYGDRGVGKTSLAKYTCVVLSDNGYKEHFIEVRCGKEDSFGSIINVILQKAGRQIQISRTTSTSTNGTLKIVGASHSTTEEIAVYADFNSPAWAAEKLRDLNAIILIDEFDTLREKIDKEKFAQLIKLLSDTQSPCVLMIVGISLSAAELLEGHHSVARILSEIFLSRMLDSDLIEIITKGEERTQLHFAETVKTAIVQNSVGFPYFTHLLSLKSAEEAVVRDLRTVDDEMYRYGMSSAIDNIDQTLKDEYENVTGGNTLKENLIYCAALLGSPSFKSSQLREKYSKVFHEEIEQIQVNNAISKALSETPDTILRKVRKGTYYFNDPRMPIYIIMRHENK